MSKDDLRQVLKKGTILIIETGEYSDRNWNGPVRLLESFTKEELADAFRREWKPKNKWEDKPEPGDFLPWLIETKRAEDVEGVHSWHVGSYGEFEP